MDELFELIVGCAWADAIVVPINTASRGPQLEHHLVLVTEDGAEVLTAFPYELEP